jgi:hypothetical protein
MKKTLFLALFVSVLLPLVAQTLAPSGPVAGFVFDAEQRAIRPVLGVAGSAYAGGAMVGGLEQAAVSPDGKTALFAREGGLYLIRNLGAEMSEPQLLAEKAGPVDEIVWNADSSSAAIYSSAARAMRLVSGLGDTPKVEGAVDVAALGARLSSFALAGTSILAGFEDAEGAALYLVPGDGATARLLVRIGAARALTVARNGRDAFVADGVSGEIFEIRNFAGEFEVLSFAGAGSVEGPVGLAISRDGSALYAASATTKEVLVFSVTSRETIGRLPLDFEPSFLKPLAGGSLFVMNNAARGSRPFLVLDTGQSPGVYFVPVNDNPEGGE